MSDKKVELVNFFSYILLNLGVPARSKTLTIPDGQMIVMGLEFGL